ncbi:hypothetical protein BDD12DRAFT_903761 [Trichophaea hybrida]|nr:hypothetical protein BDD12DRAFT_903761 [Trichophaea hybrida]
MADLECTGAALGDALAGALGARARTIDLGWLSAGSRLAGQAGFPLAEIIKPPQLIERKWLSEGWTRSSSFGFRLAAPIWPNGSGLAGRDRVGLALGWLEMMKLGWLSGWLHAIGLVWLSDGWTLRSRGGPRLAGDDRAELACG